MEDKNESYNITLTKDNTQILMEQMESSICKIRQKDGNIGTGYFCNIIYLYLSSVKSYGSVN